MIEFVGFPKISRFSRECIITEKIDGTNGCVYIGEDGEFLVGSRTRWITPETDNHGFAKWGYEHREELIAGLGVGRHFGEWWGQGIQRNYGLKEKRFSLFNVIRWDEEMFNRFKIEPWEQGDRKNPRPAFYPPPVCCYTVPVIRTGIFGDIEINNILLRLGFLGSYAVPGFMKPEGIVIYHVAGNVAFKKTIEKDDEPKGNMESITQ